MKRLSTRCMTKIGNKRDKNQEGVNNGPSRSTLNFLTQFARVYHTEPMLKHEMCEYVLN